MKKNIPLIILIVVIAAVAVYFWKFRTKTIPPKAQQAATLGEDIANRVVNPGQEIPDVNPYDAKTNPFEGTKTNPFKDTYKNPF